MNETKFDQKGSVYAKSRPQYPKELFARLMSDGIISSDSVIADVGSGTGIFTCQLASLVKTVYAVEPNDSMRRSAEAQYEAYANIVSVNASAEDTTLQSGAFDLVTAAQAFHWFNKDKFKAECRRILKPGGKVILLWNDRDEESEIIRRNAEINRAYCDGFMGFSDGMEVNDKSQFDGFFAESCEVMEFPNSVTCDLETFVGRSLSSSFAPAPGSKNYNGYVAALTELFNALSSGGTVEYPYVTRCYVGSCGEN